MPLRLLQDHLRNVEERVGPACHLNLARQRFDTLLLRSQAQIDLRQRRRRWTAFTGFAPAKVRSRAAEWPTTLALRPRGAARRSGRTATLAARAAVIPALSRRAFAARRAGPAAVAIASSVGAFAFALVVGVFGGGRLLRPGGLKEFV
jgi:hypothetical protein